MTNGSCFLYPVGHRRKNKQQKDFVFIFNANNNKENTYVNEYSSMVRAGAFGPGDPGSNPG